jgi:hypothetical protein
MSSGTITATIDTRQIQVNVHGATRDCPTTDDLYRADARLSVKIHAGYLYATREGWTLYRTHLLSPSDILDRSGSQIGFVSPFTNLQRGLAACA